MDLWYAAYAAGVVLTVAYGWLALVMFNGIQRGHQWRTNPIAVATFAIFATCTVGHATHILHLSEPYLGTLLGAETTLGPAARVAMSDPLLVTWDVATAGVAIWYLAMRQRLEILHGGAALCADMEARQKEAARLQETVGSELRKAEAAAWTGKHKLAREHLDAAMANSREIVTDLLGQGTAPGDLRA